MSTPSHDRRNHADVAGLLVRSITPMTGALAGGLGAAVPILAAAFYEMKFGRPSISDSTIRS